MVAPINTYTLLQSVVLFQPSTICSSLSKGKPPVNFPTEEKCLFTTKALEKSCSWMAVYGTFLMDLAETWCLTIRFPWKGQRHFVNCKSKVYYHNLTNNESLRIHQNVKNTRIFLHTAFVVNMFCVFFDVFWGDAVLFHFSIIMATPHSSAAS